MKPTFLFLLLILFSTVYAQKKRGIAYGHHSPEDLAVMSPNVSWWYNWAITPETTVASVFGSYGFEFVPMAWNGNYNETNLRAYLANHPETKYILAFNEPNFIEQANMKPSVVAAQWAKLQTIAKDFNLKIVSPAVNYCGNCVTENGVTYTDPVKYLDDFFAACPTCQVDYIAIHCYMNTVSALEWYIGLFKKYGKPIWLTEFAGWESNGKINTVNDQINFMIGAVDMLESNPDIFRYSWFIGRGSGISTYPYIDVLGANGSLTAIGEVYKNMPTHSENQIIAIPGTIESEAYTSMNGILLEKTNDVSGFANVGYIDANDWLEYNINVSLKGEYDIRFRIASTKSATINVLVDGVNLLTQNFPNTGGWQTWQTISNTISLTAGVHKLRLQAITSGFNINWVEFGSNISEITDLKSEDFDFLVLPNPSNGIFNIQTTKNVSELKVLNLTGQEVASLPFSNMLNISHLPSGMYILVAIDENGKYLAVRRISIEL